MAAEKLQEYSDQELVQAIDRAERSGDKEVRLAARLEFANRKAQFSTNTSKLVLIPAVAISVGIYLAIYAPDKRHPAPDAMEQIIAPSHLIFLPLIVAVLYLVFRWNLSSMKAKAQSARRASAPGYQLPINDPRFDLTLLEIQEAIEQIDIRKQAGLHAQLLAEARRRNAPLGNTGRSSAKASSQDWPYEDLSDDDLAGMLETISRKNDPLAYALIKLELERRPAPPLSVRLMPFLIGGGVLLLGMYLFGTLADTGIFKSGKAYMLVGLLVPVVQLGLVLKKSIDMATPIIKGRKGSRSRDRKDPLYTFKDSEAKELLEVLNLSGQLSLAQRQLLAQKAQASAKKTGEWVGIGIVVLIVIVVFISHWASR